MPYIFFGQTINGSASVLYGTPHFAFGYDSPLIQRNVILNQQTGGTITADVMSGYDGDIITLSNTADVGYTFNTYNLTGAILTGNQFMFSGNDVTVEPDYTHNVYNVSITQVAGGTANASPTTGYYGTQVTLSNTADTGYTFGSYSITGATLTSNKFVFNDSDVTVKPNWNHTQYSVTLTQVAGGTIAASPTTGYYGTQVTLSNTPSAEYTFGSYSITGATLTSNKFNFGTSNVTAKGSFTQKTYTLTLQTDGHGKLVANKTTGHKNDTITLTPSYSSYYRFKNYSITGGSVNGNTFTITANATAKANFKANTFTAKGNFETGTGTCTSPKSLNFSKYAKRTASTNAPTSWYATSSRWNPSNANSYKISGYIHMSGRGTDQGTISMATRIGNSYVNTASVTGKVTYQQGINYSKTFTSTTQGNVLGSARIYNTTSYGGYKYSAYMIAGTWTASGYAP